MLLAVDSFLPPQFIFFCVEAQVCAVHEEKFLLKATLSSSSQLTLLPEPWTHSFAPDSFICPRDPPAEMKSGWSSGSPGLQLSLDDCKKRRITIKMESDAKPGNKDAMTKPLYWSIWIHFWHFFLKYRHWMSIMRTGTGILMNQNGNSSSLSIKTTISILFETKSPALLKIIVPKWSFWSDAIEKPILLPQITVHWTDLKRTIFLFKHSNISESRDNSVVKKASFVPVVYTLNYLFPLFLSILYRSWWLLDMPVMCHETRESQCHFTKLMYALAGGDLVKLVIIWSKLVLLVDQLGISWWRSGQARPPDQPSWPLPGSSWLCWWTSLTEFGRATSLSWFFQRVAMHKTQITLVYKLSCFLLLNMTMDPSKHRKSLFRLKWMMSSRVVQICCVCLLTWASASGKKYLM